MREQQTPVATVRAPSPRPPVHVAPTPPPTPVIEQAPSPSEHTDRPSRPVARAHSRDGAVTEFRPPSGDAPGTSAQRTPPPDVPDLVLAAPVEMWFGDSRVGVKAGTGTYDRFRKYADALLADLHGADSPTR